MTSAKLNTTYLSVNQSNVLPFMLNQFDYKFSQGNSTFRNGRIAVSSATIPYSWLNVNSTLYNNAAFNITVPVRIGGVDTTQTLNLTLPNQFYDLDQINEYIQSQLIAAGYYLINAQGQNVFYIELVDNAGLNNAQLNCYPIPTALPTGYSYGATTTWGALGVGSFPVAANLVPQLTTLANNFGELIGFASSTTFPSSNVSSTVVSTVSSLVPQITPINSIYVGCSLVFNQYANPTSIICNIPITSDYSTNIIFSPPELLWLPVLDGQVSSFRITLYDQDFNQLPVIDSKININLLIQYEI